MNVRILFFGATADAAGEREVEFTFDSPVNADGALSAIQKQFPRLTNYKLLFARNQEYIKGEELIADGDELAVFTAVSGG